MRHIFLSTLLIALAGAIYAQGFSRADSLRGMLTPLRTCYDVVYYDLDVKVDIENQRLSGSNLFVFQATQNFNRLQFDLFDNMQVDSVVYRGNKLPYTREFNAVFVDFAKNIVRDAVDSFRVYYQGSPIAAKRAPWDGGFVWRKDKNENPFVGVACEGTGASLWWPNKDHLSDEPDSMMIRVTVPRGLMDVSNGRLRNIQTLDTAWIRYDWFVANPINNYNVTVNIARYEHFHDAHIGKNGDTLDLDYYVLPYNLDKAKLQFQQVKPMMKCYELYLGAYPFYKDGYKLVEAPYLGMEHQGAIAYGNNYRSGYNGSDFSRIGLKFDYIIIHETGHEWWGNHVSMKDMADMWIHEGFCTYTEAIYVECMHGYDTAMAYVNAKIPGVDNEEPIIGTYGVNHEGAGDMYNKGMLMLNTLRHVVNNDKLWWDIILGIQKEFGMKTTTTEEIVAYINRRTGQDLTYFFDQYLRYPSIPDFEYQLVKQKKKLTLRYRWVANVKDFHMPIKVLTAPGKYDFIFPTTEWQDTVVDLKKATDFKVAQQLFYVDVVEVK
ncbi:M1 family metallopeptidase [soil metagenome]